MREVFLRSGPCSFARAAPAVQPLTTNPMTSRNPPPLSLVTARPATEVSGMPTPGKDRQAGYRFWHPQINVTFHWRSEYHLVQEACHRAQMTPRDVLLRWARQIVEPASMSPKEDVDPLNTNTERTHFHPN